MSRQRCAAYRLVTLRRVMPLFAVITPVQAAAGGRRGGVESHAGGCSAIKRVQQRMRAIIDPNQTANNPNPMRNNNAPEIGLHIITHVRRRHAIIVVIAGLRHTVATHRRLRLSDAITPCRLFCHFCQAAVIRQKPLFAFHRGAGGFLRMLKGRLIIADGGCLFEN